MWVLESETKKSDLDGVSQKWTLRQVLGANNLLGKCSLEKSVRGQERQDRIEIKLVNCRG